MKLTQLDEERSVAIKTNALLSVTIEDKRRILFGRLNVVYANSGMDANSIQAFIAAALDEDAAELYHGWKHNWLRMTGERIEANELQSTMQMESREFEWGIEEAWNDYEAQPDSLLDIVSFLL